MNVLAIIWFIVYVFNSLAPPSLTLNVFSYILWLVTTVYLFKKQVQLSFFNFMVIFAYTTTGLSCMVAEYGSFFVETQTQSFLTGATSRNLSLSFFLLYGVYGGFSFIKSYLPTTYPKITLLNKIVGGFVPLLAVFLIAGLFYLNLRYGSPNDYNVDRFYYWTNIAPAWGDYLKFNLVQISFLLGMLYAARPFKWLPFIFILSLIAQYLVGEKFTGIFSAIVFFITPYFVIHSDKFKILSIRNIFICTIVICLFSIVIYSSYAAIVGQRNATESFVSRIILQSQMWWAVDNISSDSKSIAEIVYSFFGTASEDRYKGIFYLMSHITPPNIFEGYYDKGINFTMASPVNFIYFFGYNISLLIVIPVGFFCGIMYGIFRIAVINYDYWIILLFVKIHYTIVRILTMGESYAFTDPKFLLLCFIAFLYSLFVCLMKRREKIYAL